MNKKSQEICFCCFGNMILSRQDKTDSLVFSRHSQYFKSFYTGQVYLFFDGDMR